MKCGEVCTRCQEICRRACEHQHCIKKCGDICNIKPCYEPCKKLLKCQHPCVGFCGDPCPILCRICDYEDLTDIFLGNEDKENAKYVMLNDCKHVFESSDLEAWLNSDSNEVKPKECPRCKTVIITTVRYNEFVKRSIMDIINVKKQSNGAPGENEKERIKLLDEIEAIQLKSGKLYTDSKKLYDAINMLKDRLQISRRKNNQNHRQSINKLVLGALKSKAQLIEYLVEVYDKQEYKIQPADKSMIQISFILDAIMRDVEHISNQEIEDITLEILRLSRIIQLDKIQTPSSFAYAMRKDDIKMEVTCILEVIDSYSSKRYCNDTDAVLQIELEKLNKLVPSSVKITETERKEIVSALGMTKGHWFKCPNGHYYVICDCGGANQISTCNECGSQIGGANHRLLSNQSHAPEMDNSLYPAWSEAANLANYRI